MDKVIFAFSLLCLCFLPPVASGVELLPKIFFKGKVELKVPKDFNVMGEEMLKVKYPLKQRPTIVYTNTSGAINVALNLTSNAANQDLILPYKENLMETFKSVYPTADWKNNGIKVINGRKVGYLELITPAVDTKIYNLIFFTDLNGQLLLCTFNCTEKNITDWEPVAKEIMQSLKIK